VKIHSVRKLDRSYVFPFTSSRTSQTIGLCVVLTRNVGDREEKWKEVERRGHALVLVTLSLRR
jgi:hypothetical protein